VIVDCKVSATSLALSWKPANVDGRVQVPSIKEYAVELALIGDAKSAADQKSAPPESGSAASGSGGSGGSGSGLKSPLYAEAYRGSAPSCELKSQPLKTYLLRVRACDMNGVWSAFCSPVEYSTSSQPLIRFAAAGANVQLTEYGLTAISKSTATALTHEVDSSFQKVLDLRLGLCDLSSRLISAGDLQIPNHCSLGLGLRYVQLPFIFAPEPRS
jgi:hypothetical protein